MKKILILVFTIILLSSCSSKSKEASLDMKAIPVTKTPEIIKTPEPTPQPTIDSRVDSFLTGLKMEKELAEKRPIAIVINNLRKALPQSGISKADLYYEVLAEAGITRIIAIFQQFTSEKIGPIRSARHYFLDFVLDNDAIFVHHGSSEEGKKFVNDYNIDHLDGMDLEGITFFRDLQRAKERGLEHSSYSDSTKINDAIIKYSFETLHKKEFKPMFNFFEKDEDLLDGQAAKNIIVPFSDYQQSIFKYDENKKVYLRFQGEDKHIDEENNEQLSVKNIIVQRVSMRVIDSEGRRDLDLVGVGDGYYFTNGKFIRIKWEKINHNSPTMWYDENGDILSINKGKTWICVFQNTGEIKIINE